MAINFRQGQVALGDPAVNGTPTPTSNDKDVHVKVVKLTSANFATVAINTLVAVFPADSTILSVDYYTKTALSGNSVSSPTVSLGTASAGTQFTSAVALTNTTGTSAKVTPITAIMQNYSLPLGADINLWVSGACSTGNPTAGEIYLTIYYVR